MIDPAAGLVVGGAPARRADPDPALLRIRSAAWLVALILHAGLLWGWIHVSRWEPERAPQRIEVVFLERSAVPEFAVPAMPVPPSRPIRKVASPRPDAPGTRRLQAVEVPREAQVVAEPAPPLRLWRPDGGIVLPDSSVVLPVFDDRARITFDRTVVLPGDSDAAAAEKVTIRLRRALVPADIVNAVLRLLFAAPQPDDCPKIEARLQAGDPGISREIDLDKFRRYCK